jgi:hypothetical protein
LKRPTDLAQAHNTEARLTSYSQASPNFRVGPRLIVIVYPQHSKGQRQPPPRLYSKSVQHIPDCQQQHRRPPGDQGCYGLGIGKRDPKILRRYTRLLWSRPANQNALAVQMRRCAGRPCATRLGRGSHDAVIRVYDDAGNVIELDGRSPRMRVHKILSDPSIRPASDCIMATRCDNCESILSKCDAGRCLGTGVATFYASPQPDNSVRLC